MEKKLPLKSIDCLQKIINLNPEPIIYNYLGIAYAKLNKKEQAEKFFIKSITLANNDVTLIRNYINFLRDIYESTKAIEFLKNNIQNIKILNLSF